MITINEEDVRSQFFEEKESGDVEGRVLVKVLDLPKLHDVNEEISLDFFGILADKADTEIFANNSIKALIDF